MKYMKPRVVKTADGWVDKTYTRPILAHWIKRGQVEFVNQYLDLCKEWD